MRKTPNPAPQPKFPSLTKKCKYCHVMFKTPPTYNGQQQEFCIPAHRKAFHKEGQKPILAILKRQEKHMRQMCREEIVSVLQARFGDLERNDLFRIVREIAQEEIAAAIVKMQLDPKFLRLDSFSVKTELRPTVPAESQRSA